MFYMDFVELAHEVDLGRVRRKNMSSRIGNNAFDLSNRQFVKTYRLSKAQARSLIEISPHMPVNLRSDAIDTETKILVAVVLYATGSYQTIVGQSQSHAVSQPSVSRAIKQVMEVLNIPLIFNKYVRFLRSREDRDAIKRGFYSKYGMSRVLGCIDGTHVAIVPPSQHEERYFNRKGYHSLNTLIICDSDARILCVDPSNPGSAHDSAAWSNNPLKLKLDKMINTSSEDFYLLGDSGFPFRRAMMTPILNAAPNTPEAYYTEKHMSTRNVVERCIGILKARFRCLLVDRKLHYKPLVAAKITNACCVLHNITLQCSLELDSEEQAIIERELDERARDAHNYAARLASENQPPRRRPNHLLEQVRNYQVALVQRLWSSRT